MTPHPAFSTQRPLPLTREYAKNDQITPLANAFLATSCRN